MLIKINQKETVTKEIEIKPCTAYKNRNANVYWFILTDGIIKLFNVSKDWKTLKYISKNDSDYAEEIIEALSHEESHREVFEFELNQFMGSILKDFNKCLSYYQS